MPVNLSISSQCPTLRTVTPGEWFSFSVYSLVFHAVSLWLRSILDKIRSCGIRSGLVLLNKYLSC